MRFQTDSEGQKAQEHQCFANTAGGTLFFGVDEYHNVVGLADPQKDAEDISRLIKDSGLIAEVKG